MGNSGGLTSEDLGVGGQVHNLVSLDVQMCFAELAAAVFIYYFFFRIHVNIYAPR